MELKDAKDFVAFGDEIKPAVNGGFVLLTGSARDMSSYRTDIAAFTSSGDLIAWLSEGHANYDKARAFK